MLDQIMIFLDLTKSSRLMVTQSFRNFDNRLVIRLSYRALVIWLEP